MLRKILFGLGLVLLMAVLWYLFLKPHDYLASFKIKASVGTVNQGIKYWERTLNESTILDQNRLNGFEHQITFNDSLFNYRWDITQISDSLTRVLVNITDEENSLKQRLIMPFSKTDFEKRSEKTVVELFDQLTEHLKKFKVTINGIDFISGTYCAYIPIKCKQFEKASRMMKYYPTLDNFVASSRITNNGQPFIEIENWNKETDSISYNFCYPIKKTDSLPDHHLIKYKEFKGGKALKATFNGNYIISDRAWYALLNHAKKHRLEHIERPIEVFYTNPNFGGDELNWKAEIFMPLSD